MHTTIITVTDTITPRFVVGDITATRGARPHINRITGVNPDGTYSLEQLIAGEFVDRDPVGITGFDATRDPIPGYVNFGAPIIALGRAFSGDDGTIEVTRNIDINHKFAIGDRIVSDMHVCVFNVAGVFINDDGTPCYHLKAGWRGHTEPNDADYITHYDRHYELVEEPKPTVGHRFAIGTHIISKNIGDDDRAWSPLWRIEAVNPDHTYTLSYERPDGRRETCSTPQPIERIDADCAAVGLTGGRDGYVTEVTE